MMRICSSVLSSGQKTRGGGGGGGGDASFSAAPSHCLLIAPISRPSKWASAKHAQLGSGRYCPLLWICRNTHNTQMHI